MMRSLWTAATGMIAQQTNLDNISNNLANVNTTGYKKQTVEFKSLMYQTLQAKSTDSSGNPKPVGVQVGLGVKTGAISANYVQGPMLASSGTFDYALQGSGFFMVRISDGSVQYTRNGDFQVSLTNDGLALTDASGNIVLDRNGREIMIPEDTDTTKLTVDEYGYLALPDANGNQQRTGVQIGIATFPNEGGLERASDSFLRESPASGVPTLRSAEDIGTKIVSGYLEGSNVQTVDEMVNMIIAQRAYEMNSKAITASDEMLQQANNLR